RAAWINDDFKVTPKLTLSFGLRFDWQSGLYEQHGRFSTFDPAAQNPVGHLGATIFHSSKANGNGNWNVGPRFGFAYNLKEKTVRSEERRVGKEGKSRGAEVAIKQHM